jgi:hypothetical protein
LNERWEWGQRLSRGVSMSNQIECPKCKQSFSLDDAGYADILQQVRNQQFDEEIHKQLAIAEANKATEIELAKAQTKEKAAEQLVAKDSEIAKLKAELKNADTEQKLAVTQATADLEKKRIEAENQLEIVKRESTIAIQNEKNLAESKLKDRDEQIERLRDMKAKLSTKMVGETLEQHCEIEFNKIRSTAFPKAKFSKDNDSATGSKGDFIFREFNESGIEMVSIMFEMKNESDATEKKKKNTDFLKELDKDRREKGCEYAILVSLLESESELYNTGIVDVSHEYPKMYVIRPQFFIPMITLLRNASLGAMEYKTQLEIARRESVDVTNFENKLSGFKSAMQKNWKDYSSNAENSLKQIDDAIADLQKVKESLRLAMKHLGSLSKNAEEITVKKLTEDSPSMAEKIRASAKLIE